MSKRICVIGLGQFGREIAINLARTEEVLVLDIKQGTINEIADQVQKALRLNAANFNELSAIIDDSFDEAVVSVGEDLEASILIVLHLRKIGIEVIHAKALSDDHARILEAIGASNIIFPESETARRLCKRIVNPSVIDDFSLGTEYTIIELEVPKLFIGKTLLEIGIRKNYTSYLIAIRDLQTQETSFMPDQEVVFKDNTSLILIGKIESIEKIRELKKSENSENEV